MSVYNVKAGKTIDVSTNTDIDFTSVLEMVGSSQVVCSTAAGKFMIYAQGKWDNPIRVLNTKVKSIDNMLYINDDTVAVSSSTDSKIRILKVNPAKLVATLGDHGDTLQSMALSREGNFIASCGDDGLVKFWNSSHYYKFKLELPEEQQLKRKRQEEEESSIDTKQQPDAKRQKVYKNAAHNSEARKFLADL